MQISCKARRAAAHLFVLRSRKLTLEHSDRESSSFLFPQVCHNLDHVMAGHLSARTGRHSPILARRSRREPGAELAWDLQVSSRS